MAAKKKKQNDAEISKEQTSASMAEREEIMAAVNINDLDTEAGQQAAGNDETKMASDSDFSISPDQTEEAVESSINLDANLSIQNVVKLHEKLKKIYAAFDTIEIDASHVTSIDTATLQLFAALKKDAAKQNKSVEFFQPSARFVESARLLDLVDTLDIIDI